MLFNRLLTVCFLLFALRASSQSPANESFPGGISGTVLDSVSKQPIEYSTISLFEEGVAKAVNGSLSNAQGKFKLGISQNGYFDILVESIGYNSYSFHHILVDKNNFKNLGKIFLAKNSVPLNSPHGKPRVKKSAKNSRV